MALPIATVTRHARPPANMLTAKQGDMLLFMWDFYEQNDQLPPCEVIRNHFKFSSANAAYEHQVALLEKGWIERNAVGKFKFTALTRNAIRLA